MGYGRTSTLGQARYGEAMALNGEHPNPAVTVGVTMPLMYDTTVEGWPGHPIIGASCNVCRTLFLTIDPARAINWSLDHAHAGDVLVAELVAYQEPKGNSQAKRK